MKLGIDLDGVCAMFEEDSRAVCADWLHLHPLELEPAKVWNFPSEQWGIPMDVFWTIWFEDVARGRAWWKTPVYEGTLEALTNLRDDGHTIHIVTSRKGGELPTASWIKEFEIPYDTLTIGEDKTVVNVDLLLDDWERNWNEATDAGRYCVLFDRPWNQHVTTADRVSSWDEFRALVAAHAGAVRLER